MLILLATLICAAPNAAIELQTLNGENVVGQLVELGQEKITLTADGQQREYPVAQLQRLNFPDAASPDSKASAWVELVDGSLVAATKYTVRGNNAQLVLAGGVSAELPVRNVRSVRLKEQTPEQSGEWEKIRRMPSRSDLIVIRKGERIDYVGGVLRDVSDESVQFELDGESIPVKMEKVEGLIYRQVAADDLPPAMFRVKDIFGTELEGASWTVTANDVRFQSPAGLEVQRPFREIRQIDFSADKIVFLSDLQPRSMEWTPYFAAAKVSETLRQFYRPKMDRALMRSESATDDGKLQLTTSAAGMPAAVSYEKGIALHSRTSIVFDVPGDARRFGALAGIDARVSQHGHVRLVIRCDGQQRSAQDISGSEPPRELSIDVSGVRQLEFFVDFGDNLDVGDHLNLCNARFIK